MRVQSARELADRVAQDPELQEQIRADPAAAIANLAMPLQSVPPDVWIYRMVVVATCNYKRSNLQSSDF